MKTPSLLPRQVATVVDEVATIAGYLWERRWAERNAGNISVDITDAMKGERRVSNRSGDWVERALPFPELAGAFILVTATGSRMRDLAKAPESYLGIIHVADDLTGYNLVWGPETGFAPTSELVAHLRIHQAVRRRKGADRAVVHTHPDALIALTHILEFKDEARLNHILWGMHPETTLVVPSGVGFVPYIRTGTPELADATVQALESHTVALWEKHGCFATGLTTSDAFDAIDMVEKSARVYLMVKSAGRSPEGLTEEQLADLRKVFFGVPD